MRYACCWCEPEPAAKPSRRRQVDAHAHAARARRAGLRRGAAARHRRRRPRPRVAAPHRLRVQVVHRAWTPYAQPYTRGGTTSPVGPPFVRTVVPGGAVHDLKVGGIGQSGALEASRDPRLSRIELAWRTARANAAGPRGRPAAMSTMDASSATSWVTCMCRKTCGETPGTPAALATRRNVPRAIPHRSARPPSLRGNTGEPSRGLPVAARWARRALAVSASTQTSRTPASDLDWLTRIAGGSLRRSGPRAPHSRASTLPTRAPMADRSRTSGNAKLRLARRRHARPATASQPRRGATHADAACARTATVAASDVPSRHASLAGLSHHRLGATPRSPPDLDGAGLDSHAELAALVGSE